MSRVGKPSEASLLGDNNRAQEARSPLPIAFVPTAVCHPWTASLEAGLRRKVVEEALTWQDTPYRQLGDVKGAGIDCSMLLVRCWVDTGIVEPFDPRPYPPNWHMHHSEERYLAWMETLAEEVPRESLQPADLILFKFGKCFSHAGIVTKVVDSRRSDIMHAHTSIGHATNSSDQLPILVHTGKTEGASCAIRPRKYFSVFAKLARYALAQENRS